MCANKGERTLDTSLKIAGVLAHKVRVASLLFYHFVNAGIVNMSARCSPLTSANKGARTLDTLLKISDVLRTKHALARLLFYHQR